MTRGPRRWSYRSDARQSGIALIIVLWTVVLLMLLVTHIETTGRSEAQLALNLRRNAALQAQADGAIAVAAFHLVDQSGHWSPNGRVHLLAVRHGTFTREIMVKIVDQSGKIDPNAAPRRLLRALIEAVGVDPRTAATIAANIGAWRQPGNGGSHAKRILAQYRQAGRRYGPPDAPFESLSELNLVLGMTPHIFQLLRPDLTLFHTSSPNLAFASPAVRRAVATAGDILAGASRATPGTIRVVAVTATAVGNGGLAFTRRAIIAVGPQRQGWIKVLTWTAPVLPQR